MSNEKSPEKRRGLAWPWVLLIMAVGYVASLSLALLLIPQLSVRAAVRGGTITIALTLATMLIPKAYRRFQQRSGRD